MEKLGCKLQQFKSRQRFSAIRKGTQKMAEDSNPFSHPTYAAMQSQTRSLIIDSSPATPWGRVLLPIYKLNSPHINDTCRLE